MSNFTFTMIKPEAVSSNNIGGILKMIEDNGFRITSLKKIFLSKERAAKFYSVHKNRPFFTDLIEYMSSGPIIAAILEKNNAVEEFRNLIGSTDPNDAKEGTIRKKFATSKAKNAIHGSDSDENARIESEFHFLDSEKF